MIRNKAGQEFDLVITKASDGSEITNGTFTLYFRGDDGSWVTSPQTPTYVTNAWKWQPNQAETNYARVSLKPISSVGAIPQVINIYTQPDNFTSLVVSSAGVVDANVAKVMGTTAPALSNGHFPADVKQYLGSAAPALSDSRYPAALAATPATAANVTDAVDAAVTTLKALNADTWDGVVYPMPNGGTWGLTVPCAGASVSVPWNCTASELEAALSGIGCTATVAALTNNGLSFPADGAGFNVTFSANHGNVGEMTTDASGLLGNAATIDVNTTVPYQAEVPEVPEVPEVTALNEIAVLSYSWGASGQIYLSGPLGTQVVQHNASYLDIQAAVDSIYGSGMASAIGGPLGTLPITIEWSGSAAGTNVQDITIQSYDTPGPPTLEITQQGREYSAYVPSVPAIPAVPEQQTIIITCEAAKPAQELVREEMDAASVDLDAIISALAEVPTTEPATAEQVAAVGSAIATIAGAGWSSTDTLEAIKDAIGSGGLTQQQVADAGLLAPSAGTAATGSQQARLAAIAAKTALITTAGVTMAQPAITNTHMGLRRGDDHSVDLANAIEFEDDGTWPTIAAEDTLTLTVRLMQDNSVQLTATGSLVAGSAPQKIRFTPAHAATEALIVGKLVSKFDVQLTRAGTSTRRTLIPQLGAKATVTVDEDQTR